MKKYEEQILKKFKGNEELASLAMLNFETKLEQLAYLSLLEGILIRKNIITQEELNEVFSEENVSLSVESLRDAFEEMTINKNNEVCNETNS